MPAQLSAPTVGAQKLVRLEGEATYVLGSKNLTWELPDIVNSKGSIHEFESEGQKIRVELESAQIGSDSVSVNLKVNAEQTAAQKADEDTMRKTNFFVTRLANPLISANILIAALRIEDADGQVLRSNGLSSKGSNSEVSIRTQFFAADNVNNGRKSKLEVVGPLKLVFDGPVEFVQTQVPFAFKDVPLP